MSSIHNKILKVDLNSGKQEIIALDPQLWMDFVGGSALAARLFADTGGMAADPLSAANPLLVITGPLVGTNFPGSSRFSMCARSPLTGIWGESASGGFFGAELKKAGFDGIIFQGKCDNASYLYIEDGNADLCDADDLWGLDTYETIDNLRKRHAGKRRPRVLAIGPAGEQMVRFASVGNDKAHYFGRTGMGAVMGSKNLKAIVAVGSGKVQVADEKAFRSARKTALAEIKESMVAASMHDLGTSSAMDMGMLTGDVPMKNWGLGEDDDMASALGGPTIHETILKGRTACYACPIGCKPIVEVENPRYGIQRGPGPEYETCASFGTMIMNDNLAAVAYVNELCNRLVLDTISCGGTVAFIIDCYENGLLTKADTDGLEMTWGNMDAVVEMVNKIARREGFGDRAAMGSHMLAQSIGADAPDYAVTVKGLELPMHDPRAFHGQGLAYMNSNRGACHLQHSVQAVEQGMVLWTDAGLDEDYPATDSSGKAKMVYISENIGQMANAASVCHFVHWAMGMDNLLEGLNAATGFELDMKTFLQTGRRAWLLKRCLNNLMGVTAADDRLPQKVLTALGEGSAAGSVPDVELMKKEYYEVCGLDENGAPKSEVLDKFKLNFLIDNR